MTWAYSELLRAEARRAAQLQARDEARVIAKLTSDYAKTGQGREADANRAATQLARREAYIQAAEGEVLTASAMLCRILNLDPSIRLHPTDAFVVPHPLVPDPIPVAELIASALLHRPELAAQRAAIQAALMNLDGAKILPFSPTTLVGFSAGGFAGGSNLVRPIFGGMGGRNRSRRHHVLDDPEPGCWQCCPDSPGATPSSRSPSSSRLKSSIACGPTSRKLTPELTPVTPRSELMKTRSDRVISPTMKTWIGHC